MEAAHFTMFSTLRVCQLLSSHLCLLFTSCLNSHQITASWPSFLELAHAMSFISTPLKDLAVGDIIYVDVHIDKADMADPNSKSTTAKKLVNPSVT
jgi:hypothetical protein